MSTMTTTQAQLHIDDCRRVLDQANETHIDGNQSVAICIGALIIAVEQLAEVVEDLANREQGKVIQ